MEEMSELDRKKETLNALKLVFLFVTIAIGVVCVLYFLFSDNFRTSTIFFYLVICCAVFLNTYHNVLRRKLLEKYSLAHMRMLWRYTIVKMVISAGIILICTVTGLMSNQGFQDDFHDYYVNIIPGCLGLFWSSVFFLDVSSFTKEIQKAQGDAAVFHNNDELRKV